MTIWRPSKIISGGQTGADLGGLVGAERVGIPTGGTAPKGFKTEKGPQPEVLAGGFGLTALPSGSYNKRTRLNVMNSDATVIFATNAGSSGTKLTIKYCQQEHKPFVLIDPKQPDAIETLQGFAIAWKPNILNVAGNRESDLPG